MTFLRRIAGAEWAGLAAIFVLGSIVAAALSPSFLTEFNIYVLLRSACVGLLVAFSQMIVLARVDPYWVQFALGALVLVTVGLNRWRAVRAAKA